MNSAVGDEQLDQLEFEARAESQMPGMAAGFRVDLPAMNLYTSAYDLGLGAGLTERVDLRLDAGPRLQAWGYGGQLGWLAHQDERLELGLTGGLWFTPVSSSYDPNYDCDSGDIDCEPVENEPRRDYAYIAWTPALGTRGSLRLHKWMQLSWRLRGAYGFTTERYGLSDNQLPRSWSIEAAPSLVVGQEAGLFRAGVGSSLMWVQETGARPWWTVNLGLAFRVPVKSIREDAAADPEAPVTLVPWD